jgi:hypothetical protein
MMITTDGLRKSFLKAKPDLSQEQLEELVTRCVEYIQADQAALIDALAESFLKVDQIERAAHIITQQWGDIKVKLAAIERES